jgi:hypothetical protein
MKKIVLIACVSKKGDKKAKAEDLYKSPLFTYSLKYARSLVPDNQIFILSAKHHLLNLETEIEPYNVTLSNVPRKKRKPELKVLNLAEKKVWGNKVVEMLAKQTDLQHDEFVILAGQEYIKPIAKSIKDYKNVLEHVSLFKRVQFIKNELYGKGLT